MMNQNKILYAVSEFLNVTFSEYDIRNVKFWPIPHVQYKFAIKQKLVTVLCGPKSYPFVCSLL